MWRAGGTKVFTLEDRWVKVFATVEHWNAECVGWQGGRYAALEPISQGLTSLHGSVAADLARGLRLRMDHCSQYLSDHFVNSVRFWGITPSFAFVEQPQTKGVVERFIERSRSSRSTARFCATLSKSVVRSASSWRITTLSGG